MSQVFPGRFQQKITKKNVSTPLDEKCMTHWGREGYSLGSSVQSEIKLKWGNKFIREKY